MSVLRSDDHDLRKVALPHRREVSSTETDPVDYPLSGGYWLSLWRLSKGIRERECVCMGYITELSVLMYIFSFYTSD